MRVNNMHIWSIALHIRTYIYSFRLGALRPHAPVVAEPLGSWMARLSLGRLSNHLSINLPIFFPLLYPFCSMRFLEKCRVLACRYVSIFRLSSVYLQADPGIPYAFKQYAYLVNSITY